VSDSGKQSDMAPEGAAARCADDPLDRLRLVYSFINRTNQAIVRIKESAQLLDEACQIAVDVGGFAMSWVGLLDQETGMVVPVVSCGRVEGYLDNLRISIDETKPEGRGPTGTAVRTGEVVINRDFESNPMMDPWREEAIKRGYRSSGAFPLRIGKRVMGALTLYSPDKDFFAPEEVELFRSLADNIALAIDAIEEEAGRRAAEEEAELRAELLDTATDSVFAYEPGGRIIYANQATWATRGYTREELLLMNLHGLLTPEHAALLEEHQSRAQAAGSVIYESAHIRKDGSVMPVEVTLKPVTIQGNPLFLSVARDITIRKQVEKELSDYRIHLEALVEERTAEVRERALELEQANAELDELNEELDSYARVVSHDLKSPLSAINLAAVLLRDEMPQIEEEGARREIEQTVNAIDRNLTRAYSLINGLLALAEAGRQPARVETVDLSGVISEVIDERSGLIYERGAAVEVKGDPGEIIANPLQVYQVFNNVIGNALTHNDASEPRVIVQAFGVDESGAHSFAVCDNGSGIEPEDLERIFKPFFKGGRRADTGIGLSIAQKVVELYGGSIRAYNDHGACFEFTLRDWVTGEHC